MMASRYAAILFDVDEVLVHYDQARAALWHEEMVQHGIDVGMMDQIDADFTIKLRLLTGGSLLAEITARLKAQGSGYDPAAYMDGWFRSGFVPDTDLIEFIGEWSRTTGIPVILATNNYPERKDFLWRPQGGNLCANFQQIICSSDLGMIKTDPAYFKLAEQRIGCGGKPLKFFDDTQQNVDLANACGWEAELFSASTGRHRVKSLLTGLSDAPTGTLA